MRGFGMSVRIVLIGTIGLILLGYGWWLFVPARPVVPDVEIEVTDTSAMFTPGQEAAERARMALFDPVSAGWIVDGKVHRSARGLVPPHVGPWGPDDVGRFLRARLPDKAGKGEMEAAMRALAADGVCQAAFFAPGVKEAMVVRILRVADGKGGTVDCRDRIDPQRR